MVRRWVCGVVMVVVVILGAQGWAAPAMAQQPEDYQNKEFSAAELGAMAGGAVGLATGFFVATSAGLSFFDLDKTFGQTLMAIWGLGRALGAGLGATSAGENNGVEGNVILAYLLPGVCLSIYTVTELLIDPNPNVLLSIPHLPFIPAVLAVIGFNIGAKMKDTGQPASLPWTLDLPVLSLEF